MLISPSTPSYTPITTSLEGEEAEGTSHVRKNRNGRVVGSLRQQLGQNGSTSSAFASLYDYGQGATLHLARSSTRSRLAEAELHTALNYHLVMMASGEIVTPAIPLVFSLNSLISELSASGMGSNPNDTYSAVIAACACAMGARRSAHSFIIGTATGSGAGLGREAVCLTLANRAVELTERSNILIDGSERADQLVELLRVVLWAVAPQHVFMARLASQSINNYFASGRLRERSPASDSTLASDAFTSFTAGTPLRISDDQLGAFGWTSGTLLDCIGYLSTMDPSSLDQDLYPWFFPRFVSAMRGISIWIMRSLAKKAILPISSDLSLSDQDHLLAAVKVHEDAAARVAILRPVAYGAVSELILAVPLLFRAAIAKQATLWCEGRDDAEAQLHLLTAQTSFLEALNRFARAIEEPRQLQSELHSRAILFSSLDTLWNWSDLAISAATQNLVGSGPLASAAFTLSELRLIHAGLVNASQVFASVAKREVQIARAIAAMAAPEEASVMVEEALENLT